MALQIVSVAALLWSPLKCTAPIAVPILAAYCGLLTRCTITMTTFYYKVYWKLSKDVKVRSWLGLGLGLGLVRTRGNDG